MQTARRAFSSTLSSAFEPAMHYPPQPLHNPAQLMPVQLRCEMRQNPLGIDSVHPRLSWNLTSPIRGDRQTEYRILVASSRSQISGHVGDLWDTDRVASSAPLLIKYGGAPLKSKRHYWWRVCVWDSAGRPSAWSTPAEFEMGLLARAEWGARWIGSPLAEPLRDEDWYSDQPAPLLRTEFHVTAPVRRARLYVAAPGYRTLSINGKPVSDERLEPAWTDYSKRLYTRVYNVTRLVQFGPNALGAVLGNGWYNPLPIQLFGAYNLRTRLTVGKPCLLARLEVEQTDGQLVVITSSSKWRTAGGPVLRNSIPLGELYDARREHAGWDTAGFDDERWAPAAELAGPAGKLICSPIPPIRYGAPIKPVAIAQPAQGVYVFDMGRNFGGTVTLRTQGPAGNRVTLRYGELIESGGSLNVLTSSYGQIKNGRTNGGPGAPATAAQEDVYIQSGRGMETYTPQFTFHGFRYVEVTGLAQPPGPETVVGLPMHTDVEPAGTFRCSSGLLNRVQQMVTRTLLSNLFSVQSDCPHRERLGYGGDIVATSSMAMLNFNMAQFYAKTAYDFEDAVRPNGGFTETAPYMGIADAGFGDGSGPVGWGTVHSQLLWQLYRYYGDVNTLRSGYPFVQPWIALLMQNSKDGLLNNGISDHESLDPKPVELTGTAFYYYNVLLAAKLARVVGDKAGKSNYLNLAEKIKAAFIRKFCRADGTVGPGTQTAQAFALQFGLVPSGGEALALNKLEEAITVQHKGHIATGIFGTKYMLNVLPMMDANSVAFAVATQTDYPGWGYMLQKGATTLWEHWAYDAVVYSHNHPMFGSVSEWMFKSVAGLRIAEDAVGADHVLIQPRPVRGVTWAEARYSSARGPIAVRWDWSGGTFTLRLKVPPGVRADVRVPSSKPKHVTESGVLVLSHHLPGIVDAGAESAALECTVAGGEYTFVSPLQSR